MVSLHAMLQTVPDLQDIYVLYRTCEMTLGVWCKGAAQISQVATVLDGVCLGYSSCSTDAVQMTHDGCQPRGEAQPLLLQVESTAVHTVPWQSTGNCCSCIISPASITIGMSAGISCSSNTRGPPHLRQGDGCGGALGQRT
eukprot:GHUV01029522.1.p2 GENE.GHUV01029522.1~~GHUV01029522.1.p2  ORF type:complete len:141 (+),score=24.23 GHUV01029522.1:451-873(+)